MFTDLSLQVALGSVLSSQTSHSLIAGFPSWLGNQGNCKVYQTLFTDPP